MAWLAPAQILATRTHCVRGHEFSEANTFRKDDGNRRCKECKRMDDTAYRQRKAA